MRDFKQRRVLVVEVRSNGSKEEAEEPSMSSMTCTGTEAETGTERIPPAPHSNAAITKYPRCTSMCSLSSRER